MMSLIYFFTFIAVVFKLCAGNSVSWFFVFVPFLVLGFPWIFSLTCLIFCEMFDSFKKEIILFIKKLNK